MQVIVLYGLDIITQAYREALLKNRLLAQRPLALTYVSCYRMLFSSFMTLSNAKIIFLQQTPYKPPIASFGMNLSQPIKFDRIIVSDALNGSLDHTPTHDIPAFPPTMRVPHKMSVRILVRSQQLSLSIVYEHAA